MKNSGTTTQWSQVAPFAVLSLICFLVGSLLLFFTVWKGEKIGALGFTGRLYYVVLLPLGLSVAGFLFGVLQSYATYSGRHLGGILRLGGPIVGFLLVVILGFVLVPDLSTFPLTVYVHGTAGPQDIVLRNSGEVFIDLDGDRRHVQIGDQGQAYFPAIPAGFRSQEVALWVYSDKFESLDSNKKIKLDGHSIYLPIRRKAGHIIGRIESTEHSCVSEAQIGVAGQSAAVDKVSGHFELTVPGDRVRDELELVATAPGCQSRSYSVVPDSNEIAVTLEKLPSKSGRK